MGIHSTFTKIGVMAVLILMSAYFSATETAFSSLNRTRLKSLAEKGNHRASTALSLSENYDRMLSTILIGNNIVNIAVASIGTVLFVDLLGDIGATVSTIVVTVVVLIFGEVSPKSLAKESPERFAMFSAPILRVMIWVFTPLNFLFTQWKKLLSKVFKVRDDRKMTQEELLVLLEEVEQEGGINEDEGNLLRSAIDFTETTAEDILTHRVDLEAVPVDATNQEIARVFTETRYSRLLVYEETIDQIVGVLNQKDFYTGTGVTESPVRDVMTTPIFVPKSFKINELLKLLQRTKSHIAVVSDEYGGTLGIVTMEDILEELVGEIWDEHDEVVENFRKVAEDTYRVSCAADLDEMCRFFGIHGEAPGNSISGWVMDQLGHIPDQGDSFQYEDLQITVTAIDYRRVLELEVRRIRSDGPDPEHT